MRLLIALCVSITVFAQGSLIGVNSEAAVLTAGARDTVVSITVDPSAPGGDFLVVMLTVEGVGIEIELPDGRRVTQANAASVHFQWDVAGEVDGDMAMLFQGKVNHVILLPPKAPAGKYRIHADAGGLKADSGIIVTFFPMGDMAPAAKKEAVRVAVVAPKSFHYAGETVQLLALVVEGDRKIDDATFTGVAVAVNEEGMPQGARMPVKFRSVGQGNYSAELPTTAVGKYEVGIKVQGKYTDGTEFERSSGTSIDIQPRRAQILKLTERPVDEDGNGLIDRIEVTATIKVELPGQYSLTVDLDGGMQAYGKAELGLGEGTITASFARYSLIHARKDGPYKMSARLFRKEPKGDGFASLLNDAGITRAYERSNFDHGPLYFVGTATAKPAASTGRRSFDQLSINIDVFTPGGVCFAHGNLGIGTGWDSVEYFNFGGPLPKGLGQVKLPVNIDKLTDKADGKPLVLRNFDLECGRLRATLEAPITLPVFPAGTFIKRPPTFDLDWLGYPVPLERGKSNEVAFFIHTHGGFDGVLDLTMEGLPSGITVQNLPATDDPRKLGDAVHFQLVAATDLSLGKYPAVLWARSKGVERAIHLTIVVAR